MEIPPILQAARMLVYQTQPYLAAVLYAMSFYERPDTPPLFFVDRHLRCHYTQAFMARQTPQTLAAVLVHHIWHFLRDHATRGRIVGGDPTTWGIAADVEVNATVLSEWPALRESGIPLHHHRFYDLPEGLTAEEYFLRLRQPPQPRRGTSHNKSNAQQTPSSTPRMECGCGGNAGVPQPGEDDLSGTTSGGKSDTPPKPPGVAPHRHPHLRKQVATELRSWSRGSVPVGALRWAQELLSPQVPYATYLSRILTSAYTRTAGATDYAYTPPHPRSWDYGVVLPGVIDRHLRATIVVDTSGSMSDTDLSTCLAETAGIISATGYQGVTVIPTDAAVHSVQQVVSAHQLVLQGGGGTDMREGLARAWDQRPPADLVVVLTDGETPWPDAPPRGAAPVLIVLVRPTTVSTPAWAWETVRVHQGYIMSDDEGS